MQYWVILRKGEYDLIFYHDYFPKGLIPNHVLELMVANTVDKKLGICDGCELAYHCHVIEEGTGKKYCPILFCDVVKPNWKPGQVRQEDIMNRKKEKLVFDINDRDFNAKGWYLEDSETSKGDALVEVRYKGKMVRRFLFPAYKIWNIPAHFTDIVDGELSKNDKDKGYAIAALTGLEGILGG